MLLIAISVVSILGWVFLQTSSDEGDAPSAHLSGGMSPAEKRWQTFLSENFAGDDACVECHIDQFEAQQRSGHSHSATPMAVSTLSKKLSGETYEDPRREQSFSFLKQEDQFFVTTRDAAKTAQFPVSWLLGSGTHAQTPVSIDPGS